MFNPAQEMSSIAFDKILGDALNAVVSAQNNSSLTTVKFIKNVGFQNDENGNTVKPVYVDFKYSKEIAPYQPAIPASFYFTVTAGGTCYDEEELNGGTYEVDGKKDVVLNFTVDTQGAISAVRVKEGSGNDERILKFLSSDKKIYRNVKIISQEPQGINVWLFLVAKPITNRTLCNAYILG